MMWAFSTPANLPNEYLVVQEASDAVHVEDDDGDSDSDWGEQDETLVCRECKEDFVFTKGEQIFYRQKGGRFTCSMAVRGLDVELQCIECACDVRFVCDVFSQCGGCVDR